MSCCGGGEGYVVVKKIYILVYYYLFGPGGASYTVRTVVGKRKDGRREDGPVFLIQHNCSQYFSRFLLISAHILLRGFPIPVFDTKSLEIQWKCVHFPSQ